MNTPKKSSASDQQPPVDEEKEGILQLRQSVLRADDAYRCCKGAKLAAEKVVLDMKDVFQKIADWNKAHKPKRAGIPVASGLKAAQAMPLPELLPLPPSIIVAIPFTPDMDKFDRLLGWNWELIYAPGQHPNTGKIPLPDGWATIDDNAVIAAGLALDVCAEVIRRSKEDCMKCCENKKLGQNTPRRHRTFVGGGTIMRRESGGSKP